jgi:hypothetical protein
VKRIDFHHQIQREAIIKNAEQLWRSTARSCSIEYATPDASGPAAWAQFIDTMRDVRDNPPTDVALPNQWRRDCNFVLRVCGEIAHLQTRQ